MKHKILLLLAAALFTGKFSYTDAQTKCIWMVESKDGAPAQKIGVSLSLVKLLAGSGGDFSINGVKISYNRLLQAYNHGSAMQIRDSAGRSETKIYGGKFDEEMKESSEGQDRLIIESSDSGSATKISKVRVKSIEAVGIILAMIGSNDLDNDIDRIGSALEQGGVLYVRDDQKNSRLWIYVN